MMIDVITIILTCFVIHVTTGGLNGCGSSLFQSQKRVRTDYKGPLTEVFVTDQRVEICKTLDSKKSKAECYSASFAELNIGFCGLFPKLSEYRSTIDNNDLQDNGDECCGTISAVIPYSNIELRNMTSANGDSCRIIQLYARATCGRTNCEVCQLVTTIHYLYSFNYIKCALQFEPFEIPTYCSCQSKK